MTAATGSTGNRTDASKQRRRPAVGLLAVLFAGALLTTAAGPRAAGRQANDATLPLGGAAPPAGASAAAVDEAFAYLDDAMDRYAAGSTPRLVESYEGGTDDTAWTYDQSLLILALLARGDDDDLARARVLADALVFAQNGDPAGDGRLRDGYHARSLTDAAGSIRIAQGGSAGGNMAWAIVALLRYYARAGGERYLGAAERLAAWLNATTNDVRGSGYTGGLLAGASASVGWKSTEHNLDVYVAFTQLSAATGDERWRDRAENARSLVLSMWDDAEGHFWTGTTADGVTVNRSPIPEDAQAWAVLALGQGYARALDWVAANLAEDCGGADRPGLRFSDAGSGCWHEAGGHMAVASQVAGDAASAARYLDVLLAAQAQAPLSPSGGRGVAAAGSGGAVTGYGFSYPETIHIAPVAWLIFAALQENPYWGTATAAGPFSGALPGRAGRPRATGSGRVQADAYLSATAEKGDRASSRGWRWALPAACCRLSTAQRRCRSSVDVRIYKSRRCRKVQTAETPVAAARLLRAFRFVSRGWLRARGASSRAQRPRPAPGTSPRPRSGARQA